MAEKYMVSMAEVPVRPTPPGGYAKFGEEGARDCTEITLTCLDEPGYELIFDAFSVSSQNRLRSLLEETVTHLATEEAARGFVHPVVLVTPGHYFHKAQGREIFHFDYRVVDWMDDSGALLSKGGSAPKIAPPAAEASTGNAPPPWA